MNMNLRFQVKVNSTTHMVVEQATGRCLGACGSNFYRSWVFPLYTPSGMTVIQEFPYDHPFHNGFFVGQYPIKVGGRQVNFWMTPPSPRPDHPKYQHLGRVDAPQSPRVHMYDQGVRFTFENVWRDEQEQPVLDEVREVHFYTCDEATVCEMSSRKIAAYGSVEYGQTKHGSIGLRIEPRLLPVFGGVIIADGNRRGDAGVVSETHSAFVAYENANTGGEPFGVLMSIPGSQDKGPWFVRDYGMAMYDPTWDKSLFTPEGEEWTVTLRATAYDGLLNDERIRRWVSPEINS